MKKQLQQHSQNFENQAPVESQSEEKITGFVFLNEQFHGCIAESLRILQSKNDSNRCTFDDEEDLLMACIIEEMTIEVHGDRGRSSPPLVCVFIYIYIRVRRSIMLEKELSSFVFEKVRYFYLLSPPPREGRTNFISSSIRINRGRPLRRQV